MTKQPQQPQKQLSLLGEIRQELYEWFIAAPKDIATQPLWRQIIVWPLYIAMVVIGIFIAALFVIFIIAAIF